MAVIGKRNQLRVLREAPAGLYLDGGTHGEILLPRRYIPENTPLGAELDVFVFFDSEDRITATTESPKVEVGQFANLVVLSHAPNLGAFLDWGLPKDLLLPIREQTRPVHPGDRVIVHVSIDERSGRIVASMRLNKHINLVPLAYYPGQAVNLLIVAETDLGFKAIVNNDHWGLLYHSDLPHPIATGEVRQGFVRGVRPGGKIDLSLDAVGYRRVAPLADQIIAALKEAGGILAIGDSSAPEVIRSTFNTSKKAFKQALGSLYKKQLIRIEPDKIHLLAEPKAATKGAVVVRRRQPSERARPRTSGNPNRRDPRRD